MAFLFNGYQTSDDVEQGKQNIFSSGGTGTQAEGGNAGDQVEKTTIDGGSVPRETSQSSAGSSGQSSGKSGNPPSASSGGYNPKSVQSAYSRIGQSLQLPTQTLSKAQSDIQSGQQRLQEESNKYAAAGETAKQGYQLSQDTLKAAADGDKDAFQKTGERLTAAAPQVDAFKGLGEQIPNIDNVKDNTKAYAPTAGPNYTAGQSRMDAALLRRNPEYLKIQQQLLADQAALRKENDTAVEEKTKAQTEALGTAYKDATSDIKGRLGLLGNEITDAAKAKESAEDQRRAGLDVNTIAQQEYAKLKDQIRQDLKTADPRSQQYRSAQYLDSLKPEDLIRQFVNVDRDTDWKEFIDQPGAERYNRIQGLLGSSDMLTPSQMGAGADYAFDTGNAYRSILEAITGKRAAADEYGQQQIDQIRAAATQRAAETQNSMKSEYDRIMGQINALEGNDAIRFDQGFDLPQLGWQDILTGDEASRLNSLEGDLAVVNPGNYAASTGSYNEKLKQLKAYLDRAQRMKQFGTAAPTGGIPIASGMGLPTDPRFRDVR